MPFKLTAAEKREFEAFVKELEEATNDLNTAIREFNNSIAEHRTEIEAQAEAMRDKKSDLEAFMGERIDTWGGERDEKSERWQEGEVAERVQSLIDAWQEKLDNLSGVEADIAIPDEIEEVEIDFEDILSVPTSDKDV